MIVCDPSCWKHEETNEVVGTVDRVHELSLHVPGVVADLQIATLFALREWLSTADLNVVVHSFAACTCIYKMRANGSLVQSVSYRIRYLNSGSHAASFLGIGAT
jgi:hypothetical protein